MMMKNDKSRVVKAGRFTIESVTPHNVFRSFESPFRFDAKRQVYNLKNVSNDYSETKQESEDQMLTDAVRAKSHEWGRVFPMEKLVQKPMYTTEDGLALLLPLDNSLGLDYLTYRHPVYKKIMLGISNDIMKRSHSEDEEDAARIMLTDYSTAIVYSSTIRKDGRQRVGDEQWSRRDIAYFSHKLREVFKQNFQFALENLEKACPPRNASKGLGFNVLLPSGERYSKNNFYAPSDLYTYDGKEFNPRNAWLRKNNYPLKKLWLETGALQRNLEFFLSNCKNYHEPSVLVQAFERQALSIHTEAYRGNNADKCLNDWQPSGWVVKDVGFFKKNRIAAWECSPGTFASCLVDDKKHSAALRALYPDEWGTINKRRPIYPGPNCSFSLPFVVLFRSLLLGAEEGCCGFPSNRDNVLARFRAFDERFSCYPCQIVTFDRTNSEQFITDNFDRVLDMFPEPLRSVVSGFCTSVIPSLFGPRVVCGLISGSAATTFLNCVVGLFEMCNLISLISDVSFDTACEKVIGCLLEEEGCIVIDDFVFSFNIGTDDQITKVVSGRFANEDALRNYIESKLSKFSSDRSLSVEVTDKATVFGIDFTTKTTTVSSSLGLSKWNLLEKERNGDKCALKMYARLILLQDYYDIIAKHIYDNGGGNIGTYELGARNYFAKLGWFAFQGFSDMFNEFSPSSNMAKTLLKDSSALSKMMEVAESQKDKILIVGDGLKDAGINPVDFVDRYSVSEIEPFIKIWKGSIIDKF